jgi:hypothetical protein
MLGQQKKGWPQVTNASFKKLGEVVQLTESAMPHYQDSWVSVVANNNNRVKVVGTRALYNTLNATLKWLLQF